MWKVRGELGRLLEFSVGPRISSLTSSGSRISNLTSLGSRVSNLISSEFSVVVCPVEGYIKHVEDN